ncbi:MAG: hypothetical protein NTY97_07450 [Planctomycetota bacterium]|nr:hypothetical protein [Planctomycetota bacterium]
MSIWRVVNIIGVFGTVAAVGIALSGCETLVDRPETEAEVIAYDFSHHSNGNSGLDIVQVPPTVFAPEEIRTTVDIEKEGEAEKVITQKERVQKNADGTEKVINVGAATDEIRVKPGVKWTIESLIGQINGRPVYAGKFMTSIEDRILRIVAENPPGNAQRLIEKLIQDRFQQYINNELIISEAEGILSPEMQAGIFAWIQSLQEQTVAGNGGNRTSASQSIEDQFGMNMEQYLKEKRDEALASDLLRRRVEPRTIVSWRDVERQYSMLEKEFNPEPRITIGRIRLQVSDELEIKNVQERLKRGETFAQVATALNVPDGGKWQQYPLPKNGLAGLELADDIKKILLAVENGHVTEELRKGSTATWYCVTNVQQQATRSIFESALQRSIRRGLKEQRGAYERNRYLASLRDRWVTNDIDQMTKRLIVIAWERYLPKE